MLPVEEALQDAVKVHGRGNVAEAERMYRELLSRVPRYAAAWEHLGHACFEQERFDDAVSCYREVVALDPRHTSGLNNLGNAYRKLRRLDDALAAYDQALAVQPDFVPTYKNKATALIWGNDVAAGLAVYEEALRHAPSAPDIHNQIGQLRLLLGDFAGGWPEYEWRWKTGEMTLPQVTRPMWDGAALYGKSILLVAEQGLGDSIQFIRYAAWLKQRYNCRTLFACQPALRQLLSTCEGIDVWIDNERDPAGYDVFSPLVHVPGALGHTTHDFPSAPHYLSADQALVEQWREKLAGFPGRSIGIAWRGSPRLESAQARNVPLPELAKLAQLPGIQLFSLQKGAGTGEASAFPQVIDLARGLDENTGAFVETAAVLRNLDLLITSDTSIAHVAGALGIPVWVALCNVPDWRWGLSGDTTVWYPTMRLFRQTASGDWSNVMEGIIAALKSL